MKVRVCKKCGAKNPAGAWDCKSCGEMLPISTLLEIDRDLDDADVIEDNSGNQGEPVNIQTRRCPKCKKFNDANAWSCEFCGGTLPQDSIVVVDSELLRKDEIQRLTNTQKNNNGTRTSSIKEADDSDLSWECNKCSRKNINGNFCSVCGQKRGTGG